VVGLLLGGVLLGPYAFGIVSPESHSVDLFASVGPVFLMFIAGLEIDMRVFQATRRRSMGFGATTFLMPLLGGIAVAWSFDFNWLAAVLVGSLLASHTLLGFPVVSRLGLNKSEPVAVTVGATIFTDIASLLVLAICISIHKGGFSPIGIAVQLAQLAVYGVIVLQGLPVLAATLVNSLGFVVAIVAALLIGKFLAAAAARWFYGYDWPATLTMWSLSLPQVAATLAASSATTSPAGTPTCGWAPSAAGWASASRIPARC